MADKHAEGILFAMSGWSSQLGRAPVVAEPCVGISAFREWMYQAGLAYRPCTAMDFDLNLVPFWRALKNQGLQNSEEIKLGPQEGNIQHRALLERMSDAEGLVSGPPCQPFAGTGHRQGAQDEQGRTDAFESSVDMICELGSRGTLLWFVLENSTRLGDITHFAFLNEMLLRIETCLPFFLVDTVKLDAAEFMPVRRGRFFIRGLRRDCLPDPMQAILPAPLTSQDMGFSVQLEQLLDPDVPATCDEGLCPGHYANLALYKQTLMKALEACNHSPPSWTAVLELDRNPLKSFGGVWTWGKIPSLRTAGPQLFLLSCEDLSKAWHEMRLHRWLTIPERFRVLGQRGSLAKHFAKDSHAIHAIGNALSPVQLAAVAGPLVQAAVDSKVLGSVRCQKADVQTLPHSKPEGTSASCVDTEERKQAGKRSRQETACSKAEVSSEETAPDPEAWSEEAAAETRKPMATKTSKPKASAEEAVPQTPKPKASAKGAAASARKSKATKGSKPKASPRKAAPQAPKRKASRAHSTTRKASNEQSNASAEKDSPDTRKTDNAAAEQAPALPLCSESGSVSPQECPHQPDDIEQELEKLLLEFCMEDDDLDASVASASARPVEPLNIPNLPNTKAVKPFENLGQSAASQPGNLPLSASKRMEDKFDPKVKLDKPRRASFKGGSQGPAQQRLHFPPHLNLPTAAIDVSDSD